jgi:phosphatidylserine synthase
MTIFEYVIVTLLLIAGLGIARLLESAVDTFRLRGKIKLHWIPIAWVALVFLWQMQFLWALFELEGLIRVWNAGRYALLLAMALLLFVAGALIVPSPTDDQGSDSWEQFMADDRWALLALALFFLLAFLSNPILFGIPLWEWDNLFDLILFGVLVFALFLSENSLKTWRWITLVFALLSIAAAVSLSPSSYQTNEPIDTHPRHLSEK